jgi:hypothetical protein
MKFYFPPHPGPKQKIRREDLPQYEKLGRYFAQRKFNGVHSVIHVFDDTVEMWDRRGARQTLYTLTSSMIELFMSLNIKHDKHYVFAGELLHTKAKSKITGNQAAINTIVFFDVLFAERYLNEESNVQRQTILKDICYNESQISQGCYRLENKSRAFVVAANSESNLWLAKNFPDDFLFHFDEMFEFHPRTGEDKFPEIEGLILREKGGKLTSGDRLEDVPWLVRVRKEKPKVYQF